MLLRPIFDAFVQKSPISVMVQGLLEYALSGDSLDRLFEQHAIQQYTRNLLFSTVADLMGQVVCGVRPSVHAAYQASVAEIAVSITSVYNKLNGIEPTVCAEVVRQNALRMLPVVEQVGGRLPDWIPGYHTRILDGNHLAATEHRLSETRHASAGPLPGQALVVFDPSALLITELFPCEDGHTQERALLDEVLDTIRKKDLWLADRNFCVRHFLRALIDRNACFVIRVHAKLAWESAGKLYSRGRIDGARVREQRVSIRRDDGTRQFIRRVVLELDEPTRDGDWQLAVLTNLPLAAADARAVGQWYRRRWTMETAFQELTASLTCEIKTLCYPRAALFAFRMAVTAYNLLGVVKAALRVAQGVAAAEEVSSYYLAAEIAGTRRGMLIAIPSDEWHPFRTLTATTLAAFLRVLAKNVTLAAFRRHRRGPKKPTTKRTHNPKKPHVSTARLLEERRMGRISDF